MCACDYHLETVHLAYEVDVPRLQCVKTEVDRLAALEQPTLKHLTEDHRLGSPPPEALIAQRGAKH